MQLRGRHCRLLRLSLLTERAGSRFLNLSSPFQLWNSRIFLVSVVIIKDDLSQWSCRSTKQNLPPWNSQPVPGIFVDYWKPADLSLTPSSAEWFFPAVVHTTGFWQFSSQESRDHYIFGSFTGLKSFLCDFIQDSKRKELCKSKGFLHYLLPPPLLSFLFPLIAAPGSASKSNRGVFTLLSQVTIATPLSYLPYTSHDFYTRNFTP